MTEPAKTQHIRICVNGEWHEGTVDVRTLLVRFLREELDMTGTHIGCDTGNCGACSVLWNGEIIKSCMMLAVQADGAELTTVEGLSNPDGSLSELQLSFKEKHAVQCGYCTPGYLLAAYSLLKENPHPTEEEIRFGLKGNLCRCTGYVNIVRAVQDAAQKLDDGKAVLAGLPSGAGAASGEGR